MKTSMALVALSMFALAFAPAADAWSACLAVSCTQQTTNISNPTQTNTQTQVCAGNIQVGVALNDQKQCEQTAYQCNVNGEDVETDTFQKRAAASKGGCNGDASADAIDGVFIRYA